MTITAELAQEWLEAIKLDALGRVRDAQNRLHAIAQAGIPVSSVVAHGVGEDAFDVMDTGRSRNAADVLDIHGYPSQNALAAAARGLMFVERYGRVLPSQRDSHLYVTPVTTLHYVDQHPELIERVRLGDRIYHSGIQGASVSGRSS